MGFKSLGYDVVWLDVVSPDNSPETIAELLRTLRSRLAPFGLDQMISLATSEGKTLPHETALELYPLDDALKSNILCNHRYNAPERIVRAFKRSMLIDIDPGQLQIAIDLGTYKPGEHSAYFTVGEWVKFSKEHPPIFPMLGHDWQYIPPPVAMSEWPVTAPGENASMTTVSNWYMDNEWMPDEEGQYYDNSKRAAFLPYLDIPQRSPLPLELCLNMGAYQPEIDKLSDKGWRFRESDTVSDPQDYRQYIQQSMGEFSCAKPSYVRMKTGWLSDRTACYLASGKPVVIQKTGPSDIFPDAEGTFRFQTPDGAIKALETLASDYQHHARSARKLAEEYLDARKVLTQVLSRM